VLTLLMGSGETMFSEPFSKLGDRVRDLGGCGWLEGECIDRAGTLERPVDDGGELVGAEQVTDAEDVTQREPLVGSVPSAMPRRDDIGEGPECRDRLCLVCLQPQRLGAREELQPKVADLV
jgi:hypothetical protein